MAGDHAAVDADGTNQTAQIRRFAFNRGLSKVINSAIATPFNIADNAVEGQHVKDAALDHRARRPFLVSSQSLITKTGLLDDPPATDLVETKRFAQLLRPELRAAPQPHHRDRVQVDAPRLGRRHRKPGTCSAASTSPTASKSPSTHPAAAGSPAKRSSSKASTKPAGR